MGLFGQAHNSSSKHAQTSTSRRLSTSGRTSTGDSPFSERVRNALTSLAGVIRRLWDKFYAFYDRYDWELPHLILFPVTCVYLEIMLRVFVGQSLISNGFYPLMFGLSFGLFCILLTDTLPPFANRIVSLIIIWPMTVWFITQCLIHNAMQLYLSPGGILQAGDDLAGGYTAYIIRAIFFGIPKIAVFILPALFYTLCGKRRMPAIRYNKLFALFALAAATVSLLLGLIVTAIGGNGSKYASQYNFNTATETFGLITSTRLEAHLTIFGNKVSSALTVSQDAAEEEEPEEAAVIYSRNIMNLDFSALAASESNETIRTMDEYVASLSASYQNKYTGIFEGKNLILICAESFVDSVISPELTPTLYRLMKNGFYFSDYYQPTWGGSTITGEFSFTVGLVPANNTASFTAVSDHNLYFTLGNQLQRLGYYSAAYHDGSYDYYDRQYTHTNLGYSTYLGNGNGIEDLTGAWTGDTAMFEGTIPLAIDNQPFSLYYMTVSGHPAYKQSSEYVSKYYERVNSYYRDSIQETTKYYICYQMELENALSSLVSMLEEAGVADDTVICLTADHYPYGLEISDVFGNSEDYVTDLYGYKYSSSWEQDHNTLIIWSGCLEKGGEYADYACEISSPTYSLDVVPTLSNLFGLEYDSRLLVGRDVFSNTEALVLWSNYSWKTELGSYDSRSGTYSATDGTTLSQEYIDRINQIVANKISFSKNVQETDYYGILFGSDDVK